MLNRKQRSYLFTILLLIITVFTFLPKSEDRVLSHFTGQTMGKIGYNVKVIDTKTHTFQTSIDSLLVAFNNALSTYIPTSEISRFNQTNQIKPSEFLLAVFQASQAIHAKTNGAFDPTVGPLINRWGFGPDKKISVPDTTAIDSLLLLVGLEKVQFRNGILQKSPNVYVDFSAIAKGQGVDVLGEWLEKKGIKNYMIEIGGEVRCRGTNEEGKDWSIGIENPTVDKFEQELFAIANMKNRSLATSGNYRNYYVQDGKTYAHIVDPRTGYTAKHNLLSASVFAPDCMTADAYATAFMVLGLDASKILVENSNELDAVFIYSTNNKLGVYISSGMTNDIELVGEL